MTKEGKIIIPNSARRENGEWKVTEAKSSITFEEFRNIVRNGEAEGKIITSEPLSDFDLAVQWAMGRIGERKGYSCDITPDEIWREMYFAFFPDNDDEDEEAKKC